MNQRSHHPPSLICLLMLSAIVAVPTTGAEVYTITVEDLVPGGAETGQPLTPPVAVVHDGGYTLFDAGAFATAGLTLLAEDGVPTMLVGEAMASPSVTAVEVGAGPFVGSVMIEIDGNPGDLFSVVTMLARSNDLITGVHDVALPAGPPIEIMTQAYDAGTEMNTGLVEHIPFYGNTMVGPDEVQPIAVITSYSVLNDPVHGQLDFTFPPVARVTIERGAVPVEPSTWGRIKASWTL